MGLGREQRGLASTVIGGTGDTPGAFTILARPEAGSAFELLLDGETKVTYYLAKGTAFLPSLAGVTATFSPTSIVPIRFEGLDSSLLGTFGPRPARTRSTQVPVTIECTSAVFMR